MAEIVNLKARRKLAARAAKEMQAAENRARFGRAKAEKTLTKAEAVRATRALDAKRLDDDTQKN
jgi:hypothetical protein